MKHAQINIGGIRWKVADHAEILDLSAEVGGGVQTGTLDSDGATLLKRCEGS